MTRLRWTWLAGMALFAGCEAGNGESSTVDAAVVLGPTANDPDGVLGSPDSSADDDSPGSPRGGGPPQSYFQSGGTSTSSSQRFRLRLTVGQPQPMGVAAGVASRVSSGPEALRP